jgi:hypothetical protein
MLYGLSTPLFYPHSYNIHFFRCFHKLLLSSLPPFKKCWPMVGFRFAIIELASVRAGSRRFCCCWEGSSCVLSRLCTVRGSNSLGC